MKNLKIEDLIGRVLQRLQSEGNTPRESLEMLKVVSGDRSLTFKEKYEMFTYMLYQENGKLELK